MMTDSGRATPAGRAKYTIASLIVFLSIVFGFPLIALLSAWLER